MHDTPQQPTESKKITQILESAHDVFIRFGYRKTSMGDIAEAAGLSRQGLYFHFPTKEAVFKASLVHVIDTMKRNTQSALSDTKKPLQDRLLETFDLTMGGFVGKLGADSFDVMEIATELSGDLIDRGLAEIRQLVLEAMEASIHSDRSLIKGITTRSRVDTLFAAAAGLKHHAATREEFRREMHATILVVLAPLKLKSSGCCSWFKCPHSK